jgi:ribosomal protein L27
MLNLFGKKHQFLFKIQTNSFATKMRGTVTKNKKDSAGRRLGMKKSGGSFVQPNEIIARQRGFRWKLGENVHSGRDSRDVSR